MSDGAEPMDKELEQLLLEAKVDELKLAMDKVEETYAWSDSRGVRDTIRNYLSDRIDTLIKEEQEEMSNKLSVDAILVELNTAKLHGDAVIRAKKQLVGLLEREADAYVTSRWHEYDGSKEYVTEHAVPVKDINIRKLFGVSDD